MALHHSSLIQRAKFVGVFLLLLLALAACQSEKKEQPPTETPEASNMNEEKTSETTKEDAKVEASEDKGAIELDAKPEEGGDQSAFDDCVAKCLQRNQMRAVGADQLQRDCEAECKGKQK